MLPPLYRSRQWPRLSGRLMSLPLPPVPPLPPMPPMPGSHKMVCDEAAKAIHRRTAATLRSALGTVGVAPGGAHLHPSCWVPSSVFVLNSIEHVGPSRELSWLPASWNTVHGEEPRPGKLALGQALFSNTNDMSPPLRDKRLEVLFTVSCRFELASRKRTVSGTCIRHREFDSRPALESFFGRRPSLSLKWVLMLGSEMYCHLGAPCNSVNRCFPNDR